MRQATEMEKIMAEVWIKKNTSYTAIRKKKEMYSTVILHC